MGNERVKNLSNSKDFEFWPRWSQKTKKILFCSIPFSTTGYKKSKIWIMDDEGKNRIKLTDGENHNDFFPNWSPDSKKVVFQSNRDGNGEIYIMDGDGKNVKRLTNNNFEDSYPSFSPDGKKIIFQSQRLKKIQIFIINSDGTGEEPLFDEKAMTQIDLATSAFSLRPNSRAPKYIVGDNNEFCPNFSFDGEKIYFIMNNYSTPPQIYEYDTKSQTIRKFSAIAKDKSLFKDDYVFVSPDNKKILISTLSDKDYMRRRMSFISTSDFDDRKIIVDWDCNIWFPSWMNY
ncbi:PD40 domain-containing protein [Candidatus Desantisbacteria bacterium]|nr:PD40 domain-containing protein [Candidatus Desantisbacteria bacterium]